MAKIALVVKVPPSPVAVAAAQTVFPTPPVNWSAYPNATVDVPCNTNAKVTTHDRHAAAVTDGSFGQKRTDSSCPACVGVFSVNCMLPLFTETTDPCQVTSGFQITRIFTSQWLGESVNKTAQQRENVGMLFRWSGLTRPPDAE